MNSDTKITLSFQIPKPLFDAIEEYSIATGKSRAAVVLFILHTYLYPKLITMRHTEPPQLEGNRRQGSDND